MANRLTGVLLAALSVAGAAQEKKPLKLQIAGREVGGAVALSLGSKAPLVECVVSTDGAVTVRYTSDHMVHFVQNADHFSADPAQVGKNDNSFGYKMSGLRLSPEGKRLFGMIDRSTLAVVMKRPKILHHLRGNAGLGAFALHPDGKTLVVGMRGGIVRLWDMETGKPIRYLQAHDKDINNLLFLPGGKTFVTTATDNTMRFLTFPKGLKTRELPVSQPPRQLLVADVGASLVALTGKHVQVWDLKILAEEAKWEPAKPVVRIAQKGSVVAVAHEDGSVAVHDLKTGKRRYGWAAHPKKQIVCLQFATIAGRSLIVTAARNDDTVFWDVAKLRGDKPRKKPRKSGRRR